MARRQRRDLKKEEFWRRMVRRRARSGLSVRAWCLKHNLQQSAFYWWRREMARRDTGQPAPVLVPVRLTEDSSAKADPVIEILLANGRRVRVHGPVDQQALAYIRLLYDVEDLARE
jgi:transposase-like protein